MVVGSILVGLRVLHRKGGRINSSTGYRTILLDMLRVFGVGDVRNVAKGWLAMPKKNYIYLPIALYLFFALDIQ